VLFNHVHVEVLDVARFLDPFLDFCLDPVLRHLLGHRVIATRLPVAHHQILLDLLLQNAAQVFVHATRRLLLEVSEELFVHVVLDLCDLVVALELLEVVLGLSLFVLLLQLLQGALVLQELLLPADVLLLFLGSPLPFLFVVEHQVVQSLLVTPLLPPEHPLSAPPRLVDLLLILLVHVLLHDQVLLPLPLLELLQRPQTGQLFLLNLELLFSLHLCFPSFVSELHVQL